VEEPKEPPEDTEVDITQDPGRVIAVVGHSGGIPARVKVSKKVRFVWPLIRHPTADADAGVALAVNDAFDEIGVRGGNLKCGGANPVVLDVGELAITHHIGDYVWLMSGEIPGNVIGGLDVAGAGPAVDQIWELLQFHAAYDRNATAVAHNCYVTLLAGMIALPAACAGMFDWQSANVALTANENGKIYVPMGPGNVQYNDNGTITAAATTPLPMYFSLADFFFYSNITGGEATDTHAVAALVRRVA